MNDRISQLVDGELDPESGGRALDELARDADARGRWRRYHLTGAVIRGEVRVVGRDLSGDIMARVEQEPTVLAPAREAGPGLGRGLGRGRDAGLLKPLAWFAVAASLVLVAVVALSPMDETGPGADTVAVTGDDGQFAREFDEMLAVHGEFTASAGLNGLVAYTKLVSNSGFDE